jgi:hypothetical protein
MAFIIKLSFFSDQFAAAGGGGSGIGGGSRPIEIHLHNEVGGREFQRVVKRVALEDIGLQV